jgi:hypothetical protein
MVRVISSSPPSASVATWWSGVEDLELGRHVDIGGNDLARLGLDQAHDDLVEVAVEPADQPLEVQDDVCDVFLHAGDGGELVSDTLDLHRADGSPLEGAEQHAAQSIAEGVPEPAVERLDLEAGAVVAQLLAADIGHLELKQRASC